MLSYTRLLGANKTYFHKLDLANKLRSTILTGGISVQCPPPTGSFQANKFLSRNEITRPSSFIIGCQRHQFSLY